MHVNFKLHQKWGWGMLAQEEMFDSYKKKTKEENNEHLEAPTEKGQCWKFYVKCGYFCTL